MRMMDLNDLYTASLAACNTQQGGIMRPYTNFNAWINEISTELFNEKFGNAESSQKNDDQLDQAFLVSLNVPCNSVKGQNYDTITLPSNFGYLSAVRYFRAQDADYCCPCDEYDIVNAKGECKPYDDPDNDAIRERLKGIYLPERAAGKVDGPRWGAACGHRINPPSLEGDNIIYTQANGVIRIAPKGLGIVVLDYYRLPVKAVFAYTTTGIDTFNYNLGGSTQLDWPDLVQAEFIARIKKRYGSATRNQQQYAEANAEQRDAK